MKAIAEGLGEKRKRKSLEAPGEIARRAILGGALDVEAFKAQFQDGYSAHSQAFASEFANALAKLAASELASGDRSLAPSDKAKNVVERFARGALLVNQAEFDEAVERFKAQLGSQAPEWAGQAGAALSPAAQEMLASALAQSKGISPEARSVMAKALLDDSRVATRPKGALPK